MKKNFDSKYQSFYGLPQKVNFCDKCVISNQRPNSTVEFLHSINEKKEVIEFNEKNICSACQYHSIKEDIDWKKGKRNYFI